MPTVWVPGLLRELTAGQERVSVPGRTISEVIDALDAVYPGFKVRLVEEDRLRPSIALSVDGEIRTRKLTQKVEECSEIHFLPAISGG